MTLTEFYGKLKKRTEVLIEDILNGGKKEEVEKIDEEIVLMSRPMRYDGSDGIEVSRMKVFTDNQIIIEKTIGKGINEMSTREFIQASDMVKKLNKKK